MKLDIRQIKDRAPEIYCKLCGSPSREDTQHFYYSVPWRKDSTPSLAVRKTDHKWFDNARGESGDIFDAIARIHRLDVKDEFEDVFAEAKSLLGGTNGHKITSSPPSPPQPKKPGPILPVPATAPEAPLKFNPSPELKEVKGVPSMTWAYRDGEERVLFYIGRFETKPKKCFRPLAYFANGWQWNQLVLDAYPLYGLDRLSKKPKVPVIFVEGEKTADAAQKLYPKHAVVSLMGGTGRINKADLSPLQGRKVYLIPDNDEPGREAMRKAAILLQAVALSVFLVQLPACLPEKWDLADPVPDGVDVQEMLKSAISVIEPVSTLAGPARRPKLTPKSWAEIATAEYPPLKWAVENVLPEGLSMLAAPPKAGKSLLCSDLAACVGTGRPFLGYKTHQGRALYLDGETAEAGLSRRLKALGWKTGAENVDGYCPPPGWLIDDAGIAELDDYLKEHPDLRLVVIDTLERLVPRPITAKNLDAYQSGVARLARLQTWAMTHRICVLMVHHTGKGQNTGESFDAQSGSRGLTATAETLLTMTRVDAYNFKLSVASRHMAPLELAMRREGTKWTVLGDFEQAMMSEEKRDLIDYFKEHPDSTPKDAADSIGAPFEATRKAISRAAKTGLLIRASRGRYSINPAYCGSVVGGSESQKYPTETRFKDS